MGKKKKEIGGAPLVSGDRIQYRLKEIIDHKFNFEAPQRNKLPTDTAIELTIHHTVSPVIKYKIEDDLILVIIRVRAFIKETEETIIEAETAFVYHAIDLRKFVEFDKEKNSWKFLDEKNEVLLTTLIGISLSTMRGILHEKARGTILESAPIPIMDPSVFIKKEIN